MALHKPAIPAALLQEAASLDKELRERWGMWNRQARVIGSLFKRIRDKGLHRFIAKSGSRKGFQRFEEYASYVTGGMANSTVWVMMRIHGLTEGDNAIAPGDVDQMPQQNAYELSKLDPEQRTKDVIRKAKQTPIKQFQAEVLHLRNANLQPEDQKPILVEFHDRWPPEVLSMFEEAVSDFSLLPVARDGDRHMSIRHKAIAAILVSARIHACDEIRVANEQLSAETPEIPETQEIVEPPVAWRFDIDDLDAYITRTKRVL